MAGKRRSIRSSDASKSKRVKRSSKTIRQDQKENSSLNSSNENEFNLTESDQQEKAFSETESARQDEHLEIEATLNELIQNVPSNQPTSDQRNVPSKSKSKGNKSSKSKSNKRKSKRIRSKRASSSTQEDEEERTEATSERTKSKRELTELEKFTSNYSAISKSIEIEKFEEGFHPFDRVKPTYLLKDLLSSHSLDDVLKMYVLITKDSRTCPYLLTKTGSLLFRTFIQLRPTDKEDLCKDMVNFVKFVKGAEAVPNAELYLDFLVFCLETDNEQLIEEFGDLKKHVTKRYHLYIGHMRLCFNMFLAFINFKSFFKQFREDGLDYERYKRDEFKSKDFVHICIQLQNLTIGSESDEDYPLDYMLLCLIDLFILFRKFRKAKEVLIKYHEQYPSNLNAIIYMLRFNELYLLDAELFIEYYNKLIKLDPSNDKLMHYIDYIKLPLESLKTLLSYVDYVHNKDNKKAWRLIYNRLKQLKPPEKNMIKQFYDRLYASYWPSYQFRTVSIKINRENCDFIFYKAFVFNYFQPEESVKFVLQILVILTVARSDWVDVLNKLKFTS